MIWGGGGLFWFCCSAFYEWLSNLVGIGLRIIYYANVLKYNNILMVMMYMIIKNVKYFVGIEISSNFADCNR